MDLIVDLTKTIIFGVVALAGFLCLLVVVISLLPLGNPLRVLLSSLTMRVGATLLAGVVAIPIEPIPGLDLLYDIGVPAVLLYYWFTFFPEAARILKSGFGSSAQQAPGSRDLILDG